MVCTDDNRSSATRSSFRATPDQCLCTRTAHGQCASGACDSSKGRCFDPNPMLHMDMDQPYPTITIALDDVDAAMLNSAVLVHRGVDAGVLAFVATEGEQSQWVTAAMAPILTVLEVSTRACLHPMRPADNLVDDAAQADVRHCRFAQNAAPLTLRNCFVGDVRDANRRDARAIESIGAYTELLYSSIACGFHLLLVDDAAQVDIRHHLMAQITMGMPSGAVAFTIVAQWQTGDPLIDIDGNPRPTATTTNPA